MLVFHLLGAIEDVTIVNAILKFICMNGDLKKECMALITHGTVWENTLKAPQAGWESMHYSNMRMLRE